MNTLPPKIKNLYILEKGNFNVPPFYVVTEESILGIKKEEIIEFFKKHNTKNIIIRSASSIEDGADKSLAGFFESSDKIKLEDLTEEQIREMWNFNKSKISKDKRLYIFLQEFIEFDYSGVLFTQGFYNDKEAILELSKSKFQITSGKEADQKFIYNKVDGEWKSKHSLSKEVKDDIVKLINYLEDKFEKGADLELGILNNQLFVFQLRPITRNKDEEVLLNERNRLIEKFKDKFINQTWIRNDFINALGDISDTSINLYNHLFSSQEFSSLLKQAKFSKENKNFLHILENIGGRTYFNIAEAQKVFPSANNFFGKIMSAVSIKANEPIIRKLNEEKKNKELSIKEIFSLLYLSGNYFSFFLKEDKEIFKKDFELRLKNSEKATQATGFFFKDKDNIKEFINEYYFLGEHPYEIESKRIKDISVEEVELMFFNPSSQEENTEELLSKNTLYWLTEKVYWKNIFLKNLCDKKEELISKYKVSKNNGYKISSKYKCITGEHYPFSEFKEEEKIVVAGNIDYENILLVKEDDNFQFENKYIAVESFPNKWICNIPKLKGILTKEGSELSHAAITCREYNIPYIVNSKKFIAINNQVKSLLDK
jgi:phosphohistidine swiveling domain-containing protein